MSALFSEKKETKTPFYSEADIVNVVGMLSFFKDYCALKNIKFVVLVYPSIFQMDQKRYSQFLKSNYGYDIIPDRLVELEKIDEIFIKYLQEKRLKFVELKEFLSYDDYHQFDGHLNELGNKKVSEVLYNYLNNN